METREMTCIVCPMGCRLTVTNDGGELTVKVLTTDARWFGVTYKEDKPTVQADLAKLHESGVYPASLHE